MNITKNTVDVGTFYTSDSFLQLKSLQLDLLSKLGAELIPNEPTPVFTNGEYKYQLFTLERKLATATPPIKDFKIERLTYNQYYLVLMVEPDWLVTQEDNIDSSELYAVMNECLMGFISNFKYSQVKVSAYTLALKQLIHTLYKFKLVDSNLYEQMIHELDTLTKQPVNISCANSTLNTPRKLYLFNAEYDFKELLDICSKTLGLTEPLKEFNSGKFYEYGLILNIAEFEYIQRFFLNSYLTLNINL